MIDGVEEDGLNLSLLHIPGLSRCYIRILMGAGYNNGKCLKEASEEELNKVLPKKLTNRVQKRFEPVLSSLFTKNDKPKTKNFSPEPSLSAPHTLNTNDQRLTTILQIDKHLPDRIIFEGKGIKVTAKEFSLIYLLAQNRGKILTHNDLLDTIWKENEYATYVQITYHLYKIRRVILKTIGKNKKNEERVKDILKVISRRGIMLNLEENKLKIN